MRRRLFFMVLGSVLASVNAFVVPTRFPPSFLLASSKASSDEEEDAVPFVSRKRVAGRAAGHKARKQQEGKQTSDKMYRFKGNTAPNNSAAVKVQEQEHQAALDSVKCFEILEGCRKAAEIDDWMDKTVSSSEKPFRGWSIKLQLDFVRKMQAKKAFTSIYTFIRQFESPNVKVCTTAMFALALSSKHRPLASEVLDYMDEQGVEPTSLTFVALLGSVDGAKEVNKAMKRIQSYREVKLSDEVFNSAIFACKRRKANDGDWTRDWQTALNLLQSMRRQRIQPTLNTYLAILQVLSGTGQVQMANSILRQLKNTCGLEPDDRIWAAAMNVCADAGDYSGAIHIIEEMQSQGHEPNLLHCTILLKSFALAGRGDLALDAMAMMTGEKVVQKNESPCFHIPQLSLDLVALNTIISACAKSGDIDAAMRVVERMQNAEFLTSDTKVPILPDRITYHNILKFCSDPNRAKGLIREMRLSRRNRIGVVTPTSVSYAHAINSCQGFTTPDVDCARILLGWALDDEVEPTVYMFAPAIWAAQKSRDRAAALEFFLQMMELGIQPNSVAYNGVVSALCEAGDAEHVLLIYDEMKDREMVLNGPVFTRLAHAAQLMGSVRERQEYLEHIFGRMTPSERNTPTSGSIFEALINVYGSQDLVEKALDTYHSIIGEVNGPCLRAIVLACSLADPPRWEEATEILHTSDIVESSSGPGRVDQIALGYAIISCCKANEVMEALTLLRLYGENIRKQSVSSPGARPASLSTAALNAIIAACGRAGRPDLSLEVLSSMKSRYGVSPDTRSYRIAAITCNKAQHEETNGNYFLPEESQGFKWWECSVSLMRRMKEDALVPDVATYSATISACEAAGEWQRALGVLQSMMEDEQNLEPHESRLNLYCFNAAISACEKGEAWVEALELYERMMDIGGNIFPNFITLNSLVLALDTAGQKDLAQSKYNEGMELRIVNPWRRTRSDDGTAIRAMDLHSFSGSMAKAAIRSFMDSYVRKEDSMESNDDLVIICGKGIHSNGNPVLRVASLSVLEKEYGVEAGICSTNTGRIIVPAAELRRYASKINW